MSSVHSLDASPNPTICFYHEKFGEEAAKCKGDWCDFFKKSDSKKNDFKELEEEPKCGWCGKEKHEKSQCPARDKKCMKCNKLGHFGAVCRSEAAGDCHLCGDKNHEKNKCRALDETCRKCQKYGHFEDVCTNPFPFCCSFCGGEKHEKSQCPALDETCSKCLKIGHFGNVCLSAGSGKKQLPDLRTHLKNNQGERQPGDLRERLSRQRNPENLDSEDPIERSLMARGRSPTPLYYDNAVDQAGIAKTTIDKSSDRNLKRQSNRAKNNNNVLASSQKYCLSDIFYDSCRPSWAQTNSESQKVYIIPRT